MKIMKFFLLAAAAVAAISCAKELSPIENENPTLEVELVPMTFTACSDNGDADTKVFYDAETKTTQWKVGDEIAVISSTGTATVFTATEVSSDGRNATFEGLTENAETYYAVSPASAYKGNGKEVLNGTLHVDIPNVQNAVANTFDPAAFVSVAANDGGILSFKNSCAVIKFRLNNAEGVKSVRFTANNVKNLAGTQNVSTSNLPTHTWGDAFDGRSSYDMITLNAPEGGFNPEADYYMTVRPQTMENGINLYIEYTDGIKVRKGKSSFAAKMNNIKDLKTIDASGLEDVAPYDSYQMGFDLVVGGNVYKKAVNGDATKVTATDANTSLYNQFNKGGVYFIETSGNGSFNLHSNVAVSKDVVLVGNVANGKVLIDMNGKNVNHTAKTVALKNLELDTDAYTNYVFANNNPTADADAFILDNCSVTGLVKPLWYVNVAGCTLKNLTLVDTDIALAAGTNIIDLGKTTSLGNESVTIKNCILYGASNYVSRIVNNSQNLSEWTANVVFENNTVYNLHAGTGNGLLHMAGANSVVFKNNLVNFHSLNATEYVIRIWKTTNTNYMMENNHFWSRHYIDGVQQLPEDVTLYGTNKITWASANITSGAYPFTSSVPGAGATR